MASIILSGLWVHDDSDHDDYVVLNYSDFNDEPAISGEVRSYGSRRRIVTTDEEFRSTRFDVDLMDADQYGWLHDRRGQTFMFRCSQIHDGVWWGTVFGLPNRPWKGHRGLLRVTLTVVESSGSAEV